MIWNVYEIEVPYIFRNDRHSGIENIDIICVFGTAKNELGKIIQELNGEE